MVGRWIYMQVWGFEASWGIWTHVDSCGVRFEHAHMGSSSSKKELQRDDDAMIHLVNCNVNNTLKTSTIFLVTGSGETYILLRQLRQILNDWGLIVNSGWNTTWCFISCKKCKFDTNSTYFHSADHFLFNWYHFLFKFYCFAKVSFVCLLSPFVCAVLLSPRDSDDTQS